MPMFVATAPSSGTGTARRRYARRALGSLLLGVLIAAVMSVYTGRPLRTTLMYSIPIAAACWFFIDSGRLLAARWVHHRTGPDPASAAGWPGWPGWPWMIAVVVVGGAAGYSVGNLTGNMLTGRDQPGLFEAASARHGLGLWLLALLPALLMTYRGYLRERIAAQASREQAAQRQAAEARLKLLEAQLEPHMLFNTLATLRVLIGIDPARAEVMLDRLVAFLQATLSASRGASHTLRDEFARLADYLALMQVRMGERLEVQLDLPPSLADLPLPPLLLQPLVENAIRHGLEPRVSGGRIGVGAAVDGSELVLRVRDTGGGLGAATADDPAREPAPGDRFGLQHVRERLLSLHGEQATLVLADAADGEGGVLATVRMPLPTR